VRRFSKVGHRYAHTFQQEKDRLRIGAREDHAVLLWKLAREIPPPYYMLFLLHTSRCDHRLGRYVSPALTWSALIGFLGDFGEFLADDSRHDLWIRSEDSDTLLIWDRHNLIFAYGPLADFRRVLLDSGLTEDEVEFPIPHTHHYHPAYDDAERLVLRYWNWSYSPLEDVDRQV
jgi:hypothetical protein